MVQILSGTFEGKTLGTPICLWVKNEDARPEAYTEMATKFRPSHADYTYQAKFGIRTWPGGGRTSARETIGRVAAGAIAKKILRERYGVEVLAYVSQVQRIAAEVDPEKVNASGIESNIVRCPDRQPRQRMIRLIERMRKAGDTVGGIVEGVARGVPPGWGEPVFDRLEADLAKAMLSLPASKGLRHRLRLRRHPADRHPAQRSVSRQGRQGLYDLQPFRAAFKAAFPTARPFTSGSPSSRWPPLCGSRKPWISSSGTPRLKPRPPRSLRVAPRRADRRSHDGPGAGGSRPAAKGAVRVETEAPRCRGRFIDLINVPHSPGACPAKIHIAPPARCKARKAGATTNSRFAERDQADAHH